MPCTQGPAYQQLASAIQKLILEGQVGLHVRMPAERELAPELAVSRTTLTAAYGVLRDTGYLHSRRGSGTWTALPAEQTMRPLSAPDACIDLTTASLGIPPRDLAQAYAQAGPRVEGIASTSGYHPFGLPELRAAIADRYTRRGLPTRSDQILITTGAQQALTLTLELLCTAGDRVLVESPTYPNALAAIRRAGLRAVSTPVDDNGWNIGALEQALRQDAPRLAYLIPHFHNPIGSLMPADECRRVLDATRRSGTWLVADETLTDLALDTPVPTPFAATESAGTADHVLTVGSLSKSHWAGLRIGWVRATPGFVANLSVLRMAHDLGGPVVEQLLAVSLIEQSDEQHAGRVARVREQRAALAEALRHHLPQWRWQSPVGGLSLWVDLGQPIASVLAERAEERGVRIVGGGRFGVDPGTFDRRLRIPYALPPSTLGDAVSRLAEVLGHSTELADSTARGGWVV
ncbi:PLP-dependent aminotransferase family protein [Streptomyces sp. NPDC002205]|uniref:MocR-like transcription factor YczR n=1 Tax=Streptomyces sp. NPDC002205 TaxID=3154411 RepID=UPI00332179C4